MLTSVCALTSRKQSVHASLLFVRFAACDVLSQRHALLSLVRALVVSKVDYCNSVLTGISGNLIRRLQSVMNAAARLVFSAKRSDHITPLLREQHWLKVPERIQFRLGVLAYRCLHNTAPAYTSPSRYNRPVISGVTWNSELQGPLPHFTLSLPLLLFVTLSLAHSPLHPPLPFYGFRDIMKSVYRYAPTFSAFCH